MIGEVRANADGLFLKPNAGENYIQCEGSYSLHLQGITTNNTDSLYWSFTDKLVKTDAAGHILLSKDVVNHHGDLSFVNNKIYVAVNDGGVFNQPTDPTNNAKQWVYEYDSNSLDFLAKYPVPQAIHGAGGIAYNNGTFLLVGGLPTNSSSNLVFRYDSVFNYLGTTTLSTGNTDRGIQTAAFANGNWWFGTYDGGSSTGPSRAYRVSENLTNIGSPFLFPKTSLFNPSTGIESFWDGNLLVSDGLSANGGYIGRIYVAKESSTAGFQVIAIPVPEPSGKAFIFIALVIVSIVTTFRAIQKLRINRKQRTAACENQWDGIPSPLVKGSGG